MHSDDLIKKPGKSPGSKYAKESFQQRCDLPSSVAGSRHLVNQMSLQHMLTLVPQRSSFQKMNVRHRGNMAVVLCCDIANALSLSQAVNT